MLSESVYKALALTGGEEAQGTAEFVHIFDRFFDCLNVSSYTTGKRKRKSFQDPYRSVTDFRLEVSGIVGVYVCPLTTSIILQSGWRLNSLDIWIDGKEVFVTDLDSPEPSKTI